MKEKGFLSMLKLGFVLALYATAACVGLAFVYDATSDMMAKQREAELEHALFDLFPDADDFEAIKDIRMNDPQVTIEADKNNPNNTGAFAIYEKGSLIGVAMRTSRSGYSGAVKILVGIGVDGKISGVRILEHKETPGLGSKAGSPKYFVDRVKRITFYGQFEGKPITDPFVPKRDVVAITASTITSTAVSASVKAAGIAAWEWMQNAGGVR